MNLTNGNLIDRCFVISASSVSSPCVISALSGKQGRPVHVEARGNYGRLGHSSSEDHHTPTAVRVLTGHKVVDVGTGDAQTLAVTDQGEKYYLFVSFLEF